MISDRRHWLKKIGIGVAGIGLANFNSFASPVESEVAFTKSKANNLLTITFWS